MTVTTKRILTKEEQEEWDLTLLEPKQKPTRPSFEEYHQTPVNDYVSSFVYIPPKYSEPLAVNVEVPPIDIKLWQCSRCGKEYKEIPYIIDLMYVVGKCCLKDSDWLIDLGKNDIQK